MQLFKKNRKSEFNTLNVHFVRVCRWPTFPYRPSHPCLRSVRRRQLNLKYVYELKPQMKSVKGSLGFKVCLQL